MTIGRLMGLALAASLLPAVANADDPTDASMRNPVARARDSAATRQLNLGELARVHALEARGDLGWHYANGTGNLARANETDMDKRYQRAKADYERDLAQYERDMATWRRAVAACRSGDYSACNN